jgi:threonyl-tRNA synthetase
MSERSSVRIHFPDGKEETFPAETVAGVALDRWDPAQRKSALAASWNGVPVDLAFPLPSDGDLAPLTFEDRAGRDILQHSSAHLVAKGLVEVIPEARPTHGPPTEEGFFYDFDVRPLTPEDLDAVRAVMARAIQAREPFVRRELPRAEAEKLFAENPHKLRYIEETPAGESVSVYDTGTFTDLCRGPHVPDTGWLDGVHILGFSAITQEDPNAVPIQRVRGVGFPTRAQLSQYLKMRAEAEARDHRTLGTKLDLFSFNDAAPGFPFWHPNGMIVVRELEKFVREHLEEAGYAEIRTPLLFAQSVFETSGHWEHYRENMFLTEAEGRTFGWKPMNCPGSMLIFRSRARSYRELPMRLAEFAPLHRLEASGTLHGLTRVREFVQDDAHIFLTEEQVEPEIRTLLAWIERAFRTFRLEWSVDLSTRPAKFLGEKETWDRAEAILEHVLKSTHTKYRVAPGEGAFYGPKIDIHIRDSLGRPWQTGTIQLDYQIPARFDLEYQGPDGQLHRPVVVHRTILGTWERFLGVVIEHVAGRFPPWLAPMQVQVLPVTDRHAPAAQGLVEELRAARVRAEAVGTEDSIAKRVRNAEVYRIPWVVVLGDKEVAENSVTLRLRGSKETRAFSRPEFLAYVTERIHRREFDP